MTAADNFSTGRVGTTCRFTAALRHVETTQVHNPVIVDHLAPHLCGEAALRLAEEELRGLQAAQGTGKHLRVPMRTRILEDLLLKDLRARQAQQGCQEIQVVSVGAGLDTRPWRLAFPAGMAVHWICLDLPEVMAMKQALLKEAGAETRPRPGAKTQDGASGSGLHFPLQCSSWHGLAHDLSTLDTGSTSGPSAFLNTLSEAAYNPQQPTVWIIEAVLYYMPLRSAEALLSCLAKLSPAHSTLIATCVDAELLEASRRLDRGHIFSGLWHFDVEELLNGEAYSHHWHTTQEPRTTKAIGNEDYKADTYVALYGTSQVPRIAASWCDCLVLVPRLTRLLLLTICRWSRVCLCVNIVVMRYHVSN